MSHTADPTQFNLLDPAVRVDPYPLLARLREEDPVHWDDMLGGWILTRYADIDAALQDPRFSSGGGLAAMFDRLPEETRREISPLRDHLSMWMGALDPPDHTRVRAHMNRAFTPRLVDNQRAFVRAVADELVDAVYETGRLDVINDIAVSLPVIVIAKMLGTPREDRHLYMKWSASLSHLIGSPTPTIEIVRDARATVEEMTGYLGNLIRERRGAPPQNDLITNFIKAEQEDQTLDYEELLANCVMLLFAGHGTITVMIGVSVRVLLEMPDLQQQLREQPALTQRAVEEILRYDSPCQMIRRSVLEDVELHGKTLRKGDMVWLSLAAANRDPEQYPDPGRFDLGRTNIRHLGYGVGLHYCLGAALSRVEDEVVMNTLLERLPDMRLATDHLEWHDDPTARALKSLPVAFTPRS